MRPVPPQVRLAIVNDHAIVVAGLATTLRNHAPDVRIVELTVGAAVRHDPDVILYDTFGTPLRDDEDLAKLIRQFPRKVLVFGWDTESEALEQAVAHGAAGYLFKGASAQQLAAAVLAVARGELEPGVAASVGVDPAGAAETDAAGDWPGRLEAGLSQREAEILSFIGMGLSNEEIARRCFLSINSIKTYIRTGYRKIGASRRAQAVRWAWETGLGPGPEAGDT